MRKTLSALSLGFLLSACSPGVSSVDLASQSGPDVNDLSKVVIDDSLLSADQVYASMAELTQVAPTGAIITEWQNNSRTSLADNYKVASMSAPLMMASANLASRFCNQSLTNEIGMVATGRRLFTTIDFTKGPDQLNATNYSATIENLAQKFWGRAADASEQASFEKFRAAFNADLTAAELRQTARTRALMLGVCTAFLSSYETLSL